MSYVKVNKPIFISSKECDFMLAHPYTYVIIKRRGFKTKVRVSGKRPTMATIRERN